MSGTTFPLTFEPNIDDLTSTPAKAWVHYLKALAAGDYDTLIRFCAEGVQHADYPLMELLGRSEPFTFAEAANNHRCFTFTAIRILRLHDLGDGWVLHHGVKDVEIDPALGFVEKVPLAPKKRASLHKVEYVHFNDDAKVDRFELFWSPLGCFLPTP